MPERDLALLTNAAHQAGEIALRWWKGAPQVWEKPGLGPVTEADLAVNAALEDHLRGARPGYGWLSEESTDEASRLDAAHVFVIDPIDGTRAFIAGQPQFALSLAVVHHGVVTAAVVHLPALALTYAAHADGPATCNGTAIHAARTEALEGARVLTGKAALAPELWNGPPPGLDRHFRPSMALRLCLVADGSFDGTLSLRPCWEWDIAAGDLICARAGATVSDGLGHPIRYNSPTARSNGLIVAPPGLHDQLKRRRAI